MKKVSYFCIILIICISNCSSQISKNKEEKKTIIISNRINRIKKLIKEGKFKKAREIAEEEIKKGSKDVSIMLLLAKLLYIQKDYLSSVEILKNIIPKVKNKIQILLQIAHNYYQLKKYYNALIIYKKIITINPTLIDAYIKIGDIYVEWRNFKKASEWYNKAIAINKKAAKVYVSIANMNLKMNFIKKAQNTLQKALTINPKSFEGRKLELIILYKTKKLEEFRKKAKDFLKNFNIPEGFLFIANLYLDNKRTEKSYQYFIKALKKGKDYAPSYKGMGNYYYKTAKFEKAEYFYNKALELNPRYAEVYYDLGVLKIATSEYDKAIEYLKKAYSINKSLKISLLMIGLAYYKKGNTKKAIESIINFYMKDALLYSTLLRSNKYGPFIGDIISHYWEYYDRNDTYQKALYLLLVESQRGAIFLLRKIKENPRAYFLLSRIYFIKNEKEKGKEAFLKYLQLEKKTNNELILLDSSFNSVKEEKWFIKALQKGNEV